MNKTIKNANRLINAARNMAEKSEHWQVRCFIEELWLHVNGYVEPGYSSKFGVIATANWNSISVYNKLTQSRDTISYLPCRLKDALEKIGIETEWSDEWSACSDCGGLFRTSPDCYSWKPCYDDADGEYLCEDCLTSDKEDYLSSLEGKEKALTFDIDPEDFCYVKIEDCESGFHPGQSDSMKNTLASLKVQGYERILFKVDECGQFDTHWSVWVHESDIENRMEND